MITWVTVWVLTVYGYDARSSNANYQLTYKTKQECSLVQKTVQNHSGVTSFCAWQKIPMVTK